MQRVLAKAPGLVAMLNPKFVAPTRPFRRVRYSEFITYLAEHGIYKDEEKKIPFVYGDVSGRGGPPYAGDMWRLTGYYLRRMCLRLPSAARSI